MAQLVKFATKPHKYFAQRKEQFWPLNYIISDENRKLRKNFFGRNKAFLKHVSDIIREFVEKNPDALARANTRGRILRREHFVAEILTLAVIWQQNISREAQAMQILSRSIATLILNANIKLINKDEMVNFLSHNLQKFFLITIYTQEHIYKNLPICSAVKYFIHNKKSELKIVINKEVQILDLSDLNLQRILTKITKKTVLL